MVSFPDNASSRLETLFHWSSPCPPLGLSQGNPCPTSWALRLAGSAPDINRPRCSRASRATGKNLVMGLRQSMASTTLGEARVSIGWAMGETDICSILLWPLLSRSGVKYVCSGELKLIDNGVVADVEPGEPVFSVPLLLVSVPKLESCCSKRGRGSDREFFASSKLTRPAA